MTKIQEKIFQSCLKDIPSWGLHKDILIGIIKNSDTNGDGYKRVVVGAKTYLVPIEDIICKGLKATEVSVKYKEEK